MAKNSVQVKILGQTYTIGGDGSAEYIAKVASETDRDIQDMMQKNPRASLVMASVLTAMTYKEEILKREEKINEEKLRAANYYDELMKLKDELAQMRRKTEDYEAELVVLRDKVSRAKKR